MKPLETSVREVHSLVRSGEDALIIDVRSPSAYGRSHIAGAVNMPYASFSVDEFLSLWLPDTPVVVYCYIGVASLKVARRLHDLGVENVASMAGGHALWRVCVRNTCSEG